jgi:Outer membrane protein Omp28
MKRILPIIGIAALAFLGCKEKELNIPELSVGKRKVLIEEMTGVKCTACPGGARVLNTLQNTYGKDNLIVVSIHAAPSFSDPYTGPDGSKFDFRTTNGKLMSDFIGPFIGVPCASIARFLPPTFTLSRFVVPSSSWPGLVASEFTKDYGLGLFVKNEYNPVNRQLDVRVNIAPERTITGDTRLTVVITQDSIVDLQNDNGTLIKDYVHRHVLRDVVSQPTGNDIPEPLTAGALVSKTFSYTLPLEWDAKHCSVVAYVHQPGPDEKIVLQAAEEHVVK